MSSNKESRPITVTVFDKMQKNMSYVLSEPDGEHFHPDFKPDLSPKEMLALGVFGGKYMTDCMDEFPADWFTHAKLSPEKKNPKLNFFGVDASLSLKEWQKRDWIHPLDPRGWFQWYARYYRGRRLPDEDERQIKRWKAIARHVKAIQKNCVRGDWSCRPRQRQAVLHWAIDGRKL